MNIAKKASRKFAFMKKMELCPSIFNLYTDRYSFSFLLNDIFSGLKIFFLLLPIAFALAFFCGASPIQGVISCGVAAIVSSILGGSKYQITSIALPVCVLMFSIMSKYQYKGMLYTAVFLAVILILFAILRVSDIFKHISYSFVSAISVYVLISILVSQSQYLLGVESIQSSHGLLENIKLFKENFGSVKLTGILTGAAFLAPMILLKLFFRGFSPFLVYMIIGVGSAYALNSGILPEFLQIKTIGNELIIGQSFENIFTVSHVLPSQIFLSHTLTYAFVIALIIGAQACFCTNISSSMTGDGRVQNNVELASTGVANFLSVAFGGLFVSPSIDFSLKNIEYKSKTIISMIVIAALSYGFVKYSADILRLVPILCVSSVLITYAVFELFNRNIIQYLNPKSNESYVFLITLVIALYFGLIPAIIVGFTSASMFFGKRMINIKDATVHTTKNHDAGAIEFMTNKNGFRSSMNIPDDIMKKIEVIQVTNVLFLNMAKVIDEALALKGKYPKVLIIYFKNVPYIDGDGLAALKTIVKNAKSRGSIVMVSGTNGILLDILEQKAEKEKSKSVFGYIVPDFRDAIQKTVRRFEKAK